MKCLKQNVCERIDGLSVEMVLKCYEKREIRGSKLVMKINIEERR